MKSKGKSLLITLLPLAILFSCGPTIYYPDDPSKNIVIKEPSTNKVDFQKPKENTEEKQISKNETTKVDNNEQKQKITSKISTPVDTKIEEKKEKSQTNKTNLVNKNQAKEEVLPNNLTKQIQSPTNNNSNQIEYDNTPININAINIKDRNFESKFDSLSDIKNYKAPKLSWSNNYFQYNINYSNGAIKEENDKAFLGQKNENLFIYFLDKLNLNSVSGREVDKDNFTYYNRSKVLNTYLLKYFGFRSIDPGDRKYEPIFQRNIRFSAGTAVLLNAKNGKAAFLTNNHVVNTKNQKFWNLMNDSRASKMGGRLATLNQFMRYYKDGQFHSLSNSPLIEIWSQKFALEHSQNIVWRNGSNPNLKTPPPKSQINNWAKKYYDKYFSQAQGFDSKGKDLAIFYFNYKDFIQDVKDLAKYWQEHKNEMFLDGSGINSLWHTKFQQVIDELPDYESFWTKMESLGDLKISDHTWQDQDVDYSTKIGTFYPGNASAKNMFKGVYFASDPSNPLEVAPYWFSTNGPGASGSGVYNADGSLAFLNRIILGNDSLKHLTYDNFNLSAFLSSGVALKTKNIDLTNEIKKFYVK
ncbi:Mhp366/Mhp367 family surface (lipo)protein [Mesomycoplasma bovoculi]|uniref:Putative lipoprotein n=1 Tax=Mesomycoplasma bovoculi M165/69 TaxID=743966 RepID=W5V0K2_9BACT|nr:hypothetical protein [Mesomycoplasma bovoculi]AHH45318.1 putative lipoprotein [Mesomycoplasma bovoculi M165/69]